MATTIRLCPICGGLSYNRETGPLVVTPACCRCLPKVTPALQFKPETLASHLNATKEPSDADINTITHETPNPL
jgi:hypothetical protein